MTVIAVKIDQKFILKKENVLEIKEKSFQNS